MSDSNVQHSVPPELATPSTDAGSTGSGPKATESQCDEATTVEAMAHRNVEPHVPPPAQPSSAVSGRTISPSSAAPIESDGTKNREVRLGLVLYGGVSLAIYMNGVANEFFRAVRGRGIYQLIKILTDSDIVVDIISGTSAGGINGIFLAFALCNGREFSRFAQLWRRHGDVDRLLRKPGDPSDKCLSLFDSRGYYQPELENAFRKVYMEGQIGNIQEEVSAVPELDLFVTGTDVEGRVYTTFDDLGHAIDVKDHRTLFQLKHRHHRKEPFKPTFNPTGKGSPKPEVTYKSLATLARITSCFPAAFEPVEIPWGGNELDLSTAAGRLQEWGLLRQDEFFEAATSKYFVDGGVLNNKPFTSTLDAIFHRMAVSEVERFLMYVEPDPERFTAPVQAISEPTFSGTILDSLISLPGYQSIAADLTTVTQHNAQVDRYNRLTQQFRDEMRTDRRTEVLGALTSSAAHALHLRCRLVALSERVVRGVLRTDGADQQLGPEEKVVASQLFLQFDALMEQLGADNQERLLEEFDVYFRMRRLFYVVYRLKSLLYPKEEENELASANERRAIGRAKHKTDVYLRLRQSLNRQIELVEILNTAMEDLIGRAPIPWHEDAQGTLGLVKPDRVWGLVSALLSRLLDSTGIWPAIEAAVKATAEKTNDDHGLDAVNYTECWEKNSEWKHYGLSQLKRRWLTQRWLSEFRDSLESRTKTLIDELKDKQSIAPAAPGPNLLADIDACNARILDLLPKNDPVRRAYENFDVADSLLYPMELAGDLRAKDKISIVRISPLDAKKGFSDRPMDEKVTGVQFHHFGAFFKSSWRSNDILWGRIDAACQLTESLLTCKRLERVVNDNDDLRAKIRRRLGFDSRVEEEPDPVALGDIFPHMDEATKDQLQHWLSDLLCEDQAKRTKAVGGLELQPGGSKQSWQTRLIEAEQQEIINQDLEGVLTDAAAEQLEWNQFRTTKRPITKVIEEKDTTLSFEVPQFEFKGGSGVLDRTVIGISSAKVAREAAKRIPDKSRFFLEEYSVGLQRLIADIRAVILLEIVSKALLVLRNCILTNLGDGAQKVKAATSFRFLVDWPLRIFYYYVRWWRQAPAAHRYTQAAVFSLACALLAVGYWERSLFFSQGFGGFGWIMVGSLAVVLIMASAFWSGASWRIRYWWLELIPVAAASIAGYIWRDTLILSGKAVGQALSHVWPWLSPNLGVVIVLLGLIGVAFVAGLIVEAGRQRRNSVADLQKALAKLPRARLLHLRRHQNV